MKDAFDRFQEPERGRFGDNEATPSPGRRPRVTGASDLVDLTLQMHQNKPLAIAVTDPAKPSSKWIWLPKSQIEIEPKGGAVVVVTMPEWLASSKDLL